MKIENYISALLYRYQCVTVPGFGAFLTAIQSAQLNGSTNTFYPPKKLVSFNPHLKNNDGLLANHIALQENMPYEDAVRAIQHEVGTWIEKLQRREALALKNIGEITVNAEFNWVFEPITSVNYLSDSFGLTSVVSPSIKREVLKVQVEELEEKAPIIFTPERKKNYTFLKYAAVFVLGLGLTAAIGYPVYQQQIANETIIVERSVQKQVQNKIQEATFFIKSPLPAVTLSVDSAAVETVEPTMPYHIMAGAFRSEQNARKAYNQLIKDGFKARMLKENKHGLFPVLYGSYATMKEAEQAQKEIQKGENPQAWILVENL